MPSAGARKRLQQAPATPRLALSEVVPLSPFARGSHAIPTLYFDWEDDNHDLVHINLGEPSGWDDIAAACLPSRGGGVTSCNADEL